MPEADAQAIDDAESAFLLGGENALRDAYEAYGSLIYTFCRRFLAEDQASLVTRDVFVGAWRNRGRFDSSTSSLGGWFMAIARDRVVDSTRQQVVAHRVGDNVTTESEITQIGNRMLLADAMSRLPRQTQMVVELALVGGLTRGEVAERTSLRPQTVTSEINRGGAHLRRALIATGS